VPSTRRASFDVVVQEDVEAQPMLPPEGTLPPTQAVASRITRFGIDAHQQRVLAAL
jgi:hypothetical protein